MADRKQHGLEYRWKINIPCIIVVSCCFNQHQRGSGFLQRAELKKQQVEENGPVSRV